MGEERKRPAVAGYGRTVIAQSHKSTGVGSGMVGCSLPASFHCFCPDPCGPTGTLLNMVVRMIITTTTTTSHCSPSEGL